MKLILATLNPHKVTELQSVLKDLPINVLAQAQTSINAIEETGLSFVENALIKARHAAQYSDCPAIADDSGLAVDALDGAPGIYSARYAHIHATDQENRDKLLNALKNVPPDRRQARYHCAIAFVRQYDDPNPIICEATWEGVILASPQGHYGFGYDPVFYIPELKCTVAQLPPEIKNTLSHRAQALHLFKQQFSAECRQS